MKKLQELKQVIQEANPSIVLVDCCADCKVEANWESQVHEDYLECPCCKKNNLYKSDLKLIEIRRPITLADTINAVLEFDTKTPLNKTSELLGLICCKWNLTKDLNGQSEETINWLHSLLIKEK